MRGHFGAEIGGQFDAVKGGLFRRNFQYAHGIKFVPIGLTPTYEVDKVEVKILEAPGTALYRRITGNNNTNADIGDLGNLNVFRIRSKYEEETYRASRILKLFHKENKGLKPLKKFFRLLKPADKKAIYIKWYENELNVKFNPDNFNDMAFSKFCRDIHDYYYLQNKSPFNKYIVQLI